MKSVFLVSLILFATYSCSKEVTDYDKIVGKWIWTKTSNRWAYNSWGTAEPLPSFRDSVFVVFNTDKTFFRSSPGVPVYYRPVPISGTYEIYSPAGDSRRELLFIGQDLEQSFEFLNDGNNLILTERLSDSSIHQHEYMRK